MNKRYIPALLLLSATMLLAGCLSLQIGGGSTNTKPPGPTTGQQLSDLQNAKNAGAITDAEFEAQKAKILNSK
jgi:PBP1b-binding outer membrane lipoprotein LpoB